MVAGIRAMRSTVHIKAFTASEIAHFAEVEGLSAEQMLHGPQGGGARQPSRGWRRDPRPAGAGSRSVPRRYRGSGGSEIHQAAHGWGSRPTPPCSTGTWRATKTGWTICCASGRLRMPPADSRPSSLWPSSRRTPGLSHLPPTTGVDDLKTMAVARLLLDNFAHIKTYWVMTGLKLAQMALFFGADDMDGTVVEEVITLLSGAAFGQAVAKDELIRVIRDCGRAPVERDALYRVVRRYERWRCGGEDGGARRTHRVPQLLSALLRSGAAGALWREARWRDRAGSVGLELVPGVPTDSTACWSMGYRLRSDQLHRLCPRSQAAAALAPSEHLFLRGGGQHPAGDPQAAGKRSASVALTPRAPPRSLCSRPSSSCASGWRWPIRILEGSVRRGLTGTTRCWSSATRASTPSTSRGPRPPAMTWASYGRSGPDCPWSTRSGPPARTSPATNGGELLAVEAELVKCMDYGREHHAEVVEGAAWAFRAGPGGAGPLLRRPAL